MRFRERKAEMLEWRVVMDFARDERIGRFASIRAGPRTNRQHPRPNPDGVRGDLI
jgi:hypothetical protein